jgi:hypothetical protein
MDLQEFIFPFNPLGRLVCLDLLDFKDYPILTLERSESGQEYLSYLVSYAEDGIEQRIMVPIRSLQLNDVRMGKISIREAFDSTDGDVVYGCRLNPKTDAIEAFFIIPSNTFKQINPIPKDYKVYAPSEMGVDLDEREKQTLLLAKDRHRVVLDFYVQGAELSSGVKPWAINNVFLPTVKIIQESFGYTRKQLNERVSFPYLKAASFGARIEILCERDLFDQGKQEFNNLNKLVALMSSETKADIDLLVPQFRDESFIKEYIKIIGAIRKHDLTITSTLVNPLTDEVVRSFIDHGKADKIKTIIDEEFDEIVDVEEVEGVFLDVDFSVKTPSFAIQESDAEEIVKGRIGENLLDKFPNDKVNFKKNRYLFKIKTVYKPETTLRPESTLKTLLDYSPVV